MKKQVPEVPTYDANTIIKALSKRFFLDKEEKQEVRDIVSYHSCEYSSIVERIASAFDVEYSEINNLLKNI